MIIAPQRTRMTTKTIFSFSFDAAFWSSGICSRSRKQRMLMRATGKPKAPATHHKARLRCFRFARRPGIAPRPMEIKMNSRRGTNINKFISSSPANATSEAAGTHLKKRQGLFTLASTRRLCLFFLILGVSHDLCIMPLVCPKYQTQEKNNGSNKNVAH